MHGQLIVPQKIKHDADRACILVARQFSGRNILYKLVVERAQAGVGVVRTIGSSRRRLSLAGREHDFKRDSIRWTSDNVAKATSIEDKQLPSRLETYKTSLHLS